jgi:hypothetical protein
MAAALHRLLVRVKLVLDKARVVSTIARCSSERPKFMGGAPLR